jgi:hypothetical protein
VSSIAGVAGFPESHGLVFRWWREAVLLGVWFWLPFGF